MPSTDLTGTDVTGDGTEVTGDGPAEAHGIVARLTADVLAALPEHVLQHLLDAVRDELARRDVRALLDGLRDHLSASGPEPDVRELVELHGEARSVLLVAEEWDTGHLLGPFADVAFADGAVENVDLRRLQPLILGVSALHAPIGYAAEYRVDLDAGTGTFAPIGFGAPAFPPGISAADLG